MPAQTVEPQRLYRQIAEQLRALIDGGRVHAGAPAAGRARPGQAARREPALGARSADRAGSRRLGRGAHRLGRVRAASAAAHRGDDRKVPPRRMGAAGADPRAPGDRGRNRVAGRHAGQAQAHPGDPATPSTSCGKTPTAASRRWPATAPSTPPSRRPAATWCCSKPSQTFWDARRGPLFERLGDYFETVPSWRMAIAEHEAVLEAIRAHDAQGRAGRDAAAHGQVPRPIQRELAPRQPFLTL